jgi:uncharacterized protein YbjT (DUF2867 family)
LKVLVLGAGGFIGRHTVEGLRAAGHEVLASPIRFERALRPQAWLPALGGVEAVVNAVGILRERGGQTFRALHELAPRALFQACESAGVRRVVQISALGADEGARSRFHLSKKRADDFLASRALDWAIVQPSLVFGEGGASARLFTLLASLPLTPLPGHGRQRVQPIHVEDLTEVIVKLVAWPVKTKVHAVGPREITLRDWLALLRAQMGLGNARFVEVPRRMLPLERETLQMLERGNTASPATVTQLLRRAPRAPEQFIGKAQGRALATRARLDWLLPLLRASVAIVWVASGVVSLWLYPLADSLALLARIGLDSSFFVYGAALLDIAMGAAIYALKKRRWLWRLQILLILGYSGIIAWWLPEFLLHPFAPVLKNLPMLAAIVALHELEERGG